MSVLSQLGLFALCLLATEAAAQCGDCDRTFTQCVKGCFSESECRRACEAERTACAADCSPEQRKRLGAAAALGTVESECASGDEKACFTLGSLYFAGREVSKDYDKALKYFERACRDGQADACGMLGEMYLRPYGVAQDIPRGLTLMEKSCDRGSLEGCHALARVLFEGKHKAKDLERALKLWREGCAKKHAASCTQLGTIHLEVKHEPGPGAEHLDRGCLLGDGSACAALCVALMGERGVARDEPRALTVCAKGCADGQFAACGKQGLLVWNSAAAKSNPKKGRELLDAACEGGDAPACAELAGAAETGSHSVKKDAAAAATGFQRAARRLEKQCNENLAVRPCAQWATLVVRGKVQSKDTVRTRGMLELACSAEETLGCVGLGVLREAAQELKKALEAYQRGCDGDQAEACFRLGRLLEAGEQPDPAQVHRAYETGCARWSAEACLKLAEPLKAEKGRAKEVKELRAKACRFGAVEACR